MHDQHDIEMLLRKLSTCYPRREEMVNYLNPLLVLWDWKVVLTPSQGKFGSCLSAIMGVCQSVGGDEATQVRQDNVY